MRPIDYYSFYGFESLVEVEFQHGLQTICQKAFQWCTSLRRIALPSTVVIIEAYSFAGCESLVRVQLSEGLKYIDEGAFYHCKAIRRLCIPSTVETIGIGCFSRCYSLADLRLPRGMKTIEMGAFMLCKALERISVPSTVKRIGKSAFCECDSLLEVNFAEGLSGIESYAFAKCSSLSAVSFPSSLLYIRGKAFEDCVSLMGVEFPIQYQVSLGARVFEGCTALVNVWIPRPFLDKRRHDHYQGCTMLQKRRDRQLNDRFEFLPIHQECYYSTHSRLHDLLAAMDRNSDNLVDTYGMTPFHIVTTSATQRADLLGALINKYHIRSIVQKDDHGNTMVDYLLANRSSKAPSTIKILLGILFRVYMSTWALEKWKLTLSKEIESKCWDGDKESRNKCLKELCERLIFYKKVEQTSLLEQAIWNMTMGSGDVDRESCLLTCKSDVVIGNVKGYLWNDSSLKKASRCLITCIIYKPWLE
ncbi:MAG: hypothetical protein SGBAC_013305 [Bacillariaceae sp.]